MFVTRNVMMKYRNPTNGDGNDLGGGNANANTDEIGTGSGTGDNDDGTKDDKGTKTGPTDSEAKLIKEVMDKKTKLKEAGEKISALEAQVKRFDGIDPDAVRELLNQRRTEETKKMEERGEWDRLRTQMAEEHKREKEALASQLTSSQGSISELQSQIAELTVGNAFGQSQFIQNELALTPNKARVVYGQHFEFKDGQIVAFDKPAGAANRTPLVDSSGDPLAFEAALKKIIDADPDREALLKSKVKNGAGSKTAPKTGKPEDQKTAVSGIDRISAALASGLSSLKA